MLLLLFMLEHLLFCSLVALQQYAKMVRLNVFVIVFAYIVTLVKSDHDGSSDPLDWLRESVPGEPGVDYPVFAEVTDTSFSCADRIFGGIVPLKSKDQKSVKTGIPVVTFGKNKNPESI